MPRRTMGLCAGPSAECCPRMDEARADASPQHIAVVGCLPGAGPALEDLFAAMPTGAGIAFIVVQSGADALSVEALARRSALAVRATLPQPVRADHVYVLPPG